MTGSTRGWSAASADLTRATAHYEGERHRTRTGRVDRERVDREQGPGGRTPWGYGLGVTRGEALIVGPGVKHSTSPSGTVPSSPQGTGCSSIGGRPPS